MIENLLKDPDLNPDYHHLPMPDAGIELALQKNELHFLHNLTICYNLYASQELKKYYLRFKENEISSIKLFIIATCIFSEDRFIRSKSADFFRLLGNAYNSTPVFIDICLQLFCNYEKSSKFPIFCNYEKSSTFADFLKLILPAKTLIQDFLSYPEIFSAYTRNEWADKVAALQFNDRFEVLRFINLKSLPKEYYKICQVIKTFNLSSETLFIPDELKFYIMQFLIDNVLAPQRYMMNYINNDFYNNYNKNNPVNNNPPVQLIEAAQIDVQEMPLTISTSMEEQEQEQDEFRHHSSRVLY